MMTLGRIVALVAGSFVSTIYLSEDWVVGPVFAAVVLFWQWTFSRRFDPVKSPVFLLSSTLIYAFVIWLSKTNIPDEGFFEVFYIPVLAGTLMLPSAHLVILGIRRKRAVLAATCIYFISYGFTALLERLGLSGHIPHFSEFVFFWQASYLLFMFGPERWFGKT